MSSWLIKEFLSSWWVVGFLLLCGLFYEERLKAGDQIYRQLMNHKNELHERIAASKTEQKKLRDTIASFEDPAWIEITLKRKLGLVEDGEIVIFYGTGGAAA